MRLGVHTSIAGGVELSLQRANELSCNTLQIFSHNPRGWHTRKIPGKNISLFKTTRTTLDITPVYIHASYLINLASQDPVLLNKSKQLLMHELNLADDLNADYVVLHTGSSSKESAIIARKRATTSINHVLSKGRWNVKLILENTAGERGDISSKIEDLAEIINGVKEDGISGICIDTCHAFSAGYNICSAEANKMLIDQLKKYIGMDSVKLIHLNDSKRDFNAHVDRHEHIGMGKIGIEGFILFLSNQEFNSIPIILETPKKSDEDDPRNLKVVRSLLLCSSHKV